MSLGTELDRSLENLLLELEAISPKQSPSTTESFDFNDSSNSRKLSSDKSVELSSPQSVDGEEGIPKIRNIYDELHPLPTDPPPKKPPRSQGSPPGKKRSQTGAKTNGEAKKPEPPTANVSELDALLKTLGDNVHKTASVAQGGPSAEHSQQPQMATEMSLDDMLQELQTMEQGKAGPGPDQPPADQPPPDQEEGGGGGIVMPGSSGKPSVGGGSTTTKQLDALLVELSTFRPPPPPSPSPTSPHPHDETDSSRPPPQAAVKTPVEPAPASTEHHYSSVQIKKKEEKRESRTPKPPVTEALDSMLQELGTGVQQVGVDTTQKGHCAACSKPIHGKLLNAMSRTWHPEHFVCAICEEELASRSFYEYDGKPYCEKDYNEMLAPRCAYCNGPILERCINAMNKAWHPEHFFCALCGKLFDEDNLNFFEKDGKAYCKEDYFDNFAVTCKRCSKAIMSGYLSAVGSYWHPNCFSCKTCSKSFPKMNFFEHEGEPYCELHYHAARGSLCFKCQKPITRECVNAMGKKFHPECFACAFCNERLKQGNFKEHRGNAYCVACYCKLFEKN